LRETIRDSIFSGLREQYSSPLKVTSSKLIEMKKNRKVMSCTIKEEKLHYLF
jgi:hypothetical protein